MSDHGGASPTLAARLEERCRRFEGAAEAVDLPARSCFLTSAALIRVGDLTAAQHAFDAGMAALPVEEPIPEDDPPAPVEVAVLPIAAQAPPTPTATVAVRYREAVRAWFIAAKAGGSTREDRLEGSVRGIEEAAASAEMPSMWYWLESARLIRAGDLAGAQVAFDAGMAPPPVAVAEPAAPDAASGR